MKICISCIFSKSFIVFKYDSKGINQEFILFGQSLNKQFIQYNLMTAC